MLLSSFLLDGGMCVSELSGNTAVFAKSVAMLGSSEDNTALSRALSQLAEVEEKIDQLHQDQVYADFYLFSELLGDYVRLLTAVKVSRPPLKHHLLTRDSRHHMIIQSRGLRGAAGHVTCHVSAGRVRPADENVGQMAGRADDAAEEERG